MKKKFVQIAAIVLALSLLPTSFAAEADESAVRSASQNDPVDDSFVFESVEETTDSEQDATDFGNDELDSEQGTVSDEVAPEDVTTGAEGDETDQEQGSVESEDDVNDPEQGSTDPSEDVENPEQGNADSGEGNEDPEEGGTNPGEDTENPEQGSTDPDEGDEDPEQGSTDPDEGDEDPEQGGTEPDDDVYPEQGGNQPEDPVEPVEPAEPDVPEIIVPVLETEEENETVIRVGLNYGSSALTSANLWNSVGTGYRFGFHVGSVFNQVGSSSQTKISILKTQNLYYTSVMSDGYSGYGSSETTGPAVGCVHLQLPGTYATFAETKAAADSVGGFPAWINGEFVVRYGVFLTADAARSAQVSNNLINTSVVGTSEYGLTVVITGTNIPIFQYDGGAEHSKFVVKPGLDNSVKSATHYKGIKYYDNFRFERIDGGDITVVNLVDVDDYVRGVIPYEMSPSFPLEALKAQVVTARSYAFANTNKSHQKLGFDVCTSIHCQVYYGIGGATEHTDRAVDETAGLFAWYEDEIILAVFHSSDGGATENSENVWFEALPYLRGVEDPYEALALDMIKAYKQNYNWTKTYTGAQLKNLLNEKGFMCSEIIDIKAKNTDTGNVYSITLTDTNGKSWTFSKQDMKTKFGLSSMRFTVSNGVDGYTLTNEQTIAAVNGAWVIGADGQLVQISASPVYALTSGGVQEVEGSDLSDMKFVFEGTGSGHNLGMSQWGAYAMAKEGFTFDQILKFYYTGIEIHE